METKPCCLIDSIFLPYVIWTEASIIFDIIKPFRRIFQMLFRFSLNGPAHIQKNFANSLRSPIRTVHWGRYFVDVSATLDLSMPPGSFIGYDRMSDLECATFLNSALV